MDKFRDYMRLTDSFPPTWWFVGGSVVDFRKATDVDIYIQVDTLEGVLNTYVLGLKNFLIVKEVKTLGDEVAYNGGSGLVVVEVTLHEWIKPKPKPVHLIFGTLSLMDYLRTFDISTHMWALDKNGEAYCLPASTLPTVCPRIVRISDEWKQREKTLERYKKLCRRYGFKMKKNAVPKTGAAVPLQIYKTK